MRLSKHPGYQAKTFGTPYIIYMVRSHYISLVKIKTDFSNFQRMSIRLLATYSYNKIGGSLYYILQAGPDSAVGSLDVLHEDVGGYLLGGGEEGPLDFIRGPVVSLSATLH